MNWVRGKGASYSGRGRSAQPTKRIDRIADATGPTTLNFMRVDRSWRWKKNELILSSIGQLLRKSRIWNKARELCAGLGFCFWCLAVGSVGGGVSRASLSIRR